MREEIVIGWEEWRASRTGKRANLERLGLNKPSRRTTDYSTSGNRLRKAFGDLHGSCDVLADRILKKLYPSDDRLPLPAH